MKKIIRKNFDLRNKPLDDWSFSVMPKISKTEPQPLPKKKLSKWAIFPFVAGVLVIMFLMQFLVYASSAKNAQGQILGAATSAYGDLTAAGTSLGSQNFTDAQTKFSDALTSLQSAQDQLNSFKALALVAPQVGSADHILSGATLLASAGSKLTDTLSIFKDLKVSSSGIGTDNLPTLLSQNKDSLNQALDLLKQAQGEFAAASNVPADYADTLTKAKTEVSALTGMVGQLVDLEDIYLGFFGGGPKVYLLLFENYDEVRATGGFLGTYGVLKVDSGKIQDLSIKSIYDLDGQIYDNVAAPGPFQPYIQKWGIRDANWFADFPTSAGKLLQFFEDGSQTADGVIAFTPSMFENLLSLTGPIAMPKYGVTLTSDNFQDIVQFETSVAYSKTLNEPKQMLADFAPLLLNRLGSLNQTQWLQLLQIMQDNLSQKQVLLYSKDPNLEQRIEDLKVAGNILPTDKDYLDIVNTNLSGTKSDLKIAQTANFKAKIMSDGSVIDTLTIERKNTGTQKNTDFLRVLVPDNSILVSSAGFDEGVFNPSEAKGFTTDPDLANWDKGSLYGDRTFVRQESGKTEFSGWLSLESGDDKIITLVYQIPYKVQSGIISGSASYSLLFQKQDGVLPYDFLASLDTGKLKSSWLSADAQEDSGTINFNYTTKSDEYWATILK